MRKACAVIDQHPELVEIYRLMEERSKKAKVQCEFLENRAKQIKEAWEKDRMIEWQMMEDWLREHGHLPKDYSKDNYMMSTDSGVLSLIDKRDRGDHPSGLPKHIIETIIRSLT